MSTLRPFRLMFAIVLLTQNIWASTINTSDSLALVSLYNSTNGQNWVKNDNWLTGPVKTWYGLVFDKDSLKAINLSGNNLSGTLPIDLYSLRTLKYIYISFNELTGTLSNNIENLHNLVVLWASYNKLEGAIPAGLGNIDSLKTLYLNNNQFGGSIPATIGNLSKLENLNLSFNNFSGAVPEGLTGLVNLKYIYLNDNKLTGELPETFGQMVQLRALRLENNFLTGIPNLTLLTHLKNIPGEKNFAINNNYFDFVDLLKNRQMFINEANYFPQRTFPLSGIKYIKPGDSVYLNLPSMSYIDTSSKENQYSYYLDGKLLRGWNSAQDMIYVQQFFQIWAHTFVMLSMIVFPTNPLQYPMSGFYLQQGFRGYRLQHYLGEN
jgi:Leucine-rich repeat (LRR) protein